MVSFYVSHDYLINLSGYSGLLNNWYQTVQTLLSFSDIFFVDTQNECIPISVKVKVFISYFDMITLTGHFSFICKFYF